jgi:CheY-like chemotaxis protein
MPRPCIILLDLLMPVMDGSEFLRAKGDDDLIAAIPVAIVSGVSERPELTGGAVGFLRKPFDFEGLLRFIGPYCDQERELNAGEYKDTDPAKNI